MTHEKNSPSPSSQSPSPDLGPEFDPPSPTATASPVSSPYDPFPDTPEFENSPELVSIPSYPPLRQVAEVWSISTETEEYSNLGTSATIWYEENDCCLSRPDPVEEVLGFQDRGRDQNQNLRLRVTKSTLPLCRPSQLRSRARNPPPQEPKRGARADRW